MSGDVRRSVTALSLQLPPARSRAPFVLAYNLGRVASYVLVGAIVGGLGGLGLAALGIRGAQLGLFVLAQCLMILLGSVSGLVMWWKRKPAGGLGVPPLRHDLPRWRMAVGVMVVLGVAFPLVGGSMVVMWVVDSLVVRRRVLVRA